MAERFARQLVCPDGHKEVVRTGQPAAKLASTGTSRMCAGCGRNRVMKLKDDGERRCSRCRCILSSNTAYDEYVCGPCRISLKAAADNSEGYYITGVRPSQHAARGAHPGTATGLVGNRQTSDGRRRGE